MPLFRYQFRYQWVKVKLQKTPKLYVITEKYEQAQVAVNTDIALIALRLLILYQEQHGLSCGESNKSYDG